jgi:hypothetical protein
MAAAQMAKKEAKKLRKAAARADASLHGSGSGGADEVIE